MSEAVKAESAEAPKEVPLSPSYWRLVARQFLKRRLNKGALLIILALLLLALGADFLASDKPIHLVMDGESYWFPNIVHYPELQIYDNTMLLEHMGPDDSIVLPMVPWGYNSHDMSQVLKPPSADHWLGTDPAGRDVLSRIIHGSRISLAVGVLAVLVLCSLGTLLGTLAGYFGGLLDQGLMRLLEIVLSMPTLLVIVVAFAVMAPQGWTAVFAMMVVIGLIRWTTVARLIRGEILKVKTLDYIEAARALGMGHTRIMLKHIIPNSISPVLVAATFAMANAILIESSLSFLGFGIPDDMASWGGLLQAVRSNHEAWWLAVFPGFAIFVTVTVYNLAGEGMRDAIDPRMKN